MAAIGHVGGCSSLQDIDVQTHNQHVASVSEHAFLSDICRDYLWSFILQPKEKCTEYIPAFNVREGERKYRQTDRQADRQEKAGRQVGRSKLVT